MATTTVASGRPKKTELSGCIERVFWTSEDRSYMIARLQSGIDIKGRVRPEEFPEIGIPYKFQGRFVENEQYGEQFQFEAYMTHEPIDRAGTVAYLCKFIPGFGRVRANQIVDLYGAEAISVLKTNPKRVAEQIAGLTAEAAEKAATALKSQSEFQETKIQLYGIFEKRGFRAETVDRAIGMWGINAARKIQRDPFCLITVKPKFAGASFIKCDRLYAEFGHPPDRMKRQVLAMAYVIESDRSGSTWFREDWLIGEAGRMVSGNYRPKKALKLGLRAKLLSRHTDADGVNWIADFDGAASERQIADYVSMVLV